jgi:aspartate carbamoyltransferase catalytic subunit
VLNLDVNMSSRSKGESILDTIYTLQAMQVDVFVIRDASPGIPAFIAEHTAPHVSVLNAGEGNVSHPTQGLLDLLTIRQRKPRLDNVSVAIVGDVAHSRVARSAWEALTAFSVGELRLVAPAELMPADSDFPGATRYTDADAGVAGADVVMALRIQRERMREMECVPDVEEYYRRYGISRERMRLAHSDAIVMHPGPMNRGVEIEGALADSPRSVITDQVTNGVAVRMAVLATVTETVLGPGR